MQERACTHHFHAPLLASFLYFVSQVQRRMVYFIQTAGKARWVIVFFENAALVGLFFCRCCPVIYDIVKQKGRTHQLKIAGMSVSTCSGCRFPLIYSCAGWVRGGKGRRLSFVAVGRPTKTTRFDHGFL